MTVSDMARLGGKKRAEVLSEKRRKEIASNAGKANKGKKRAKNKDRKLSTVILNIT